MISGYRLKIQKLQSGFTLVELLVVIAILGILSTIGLAAFSSTQARGRDAQRKSDLKQIASALEIYYNDYEVYPSSSVNGKMLGCPSTTSTECTWGSSQFTDSKTVYLKTMPKDPAGNFKYYYRTVKSGQGFQLYAELENSQDVSTCIGGNCGSHNDLPSGVSCGSGITCNFAITSPNVTYNTN